MTRTAAVAMIVTRTVIKKRSGALRADYIDVPAECSAKYKNQSSILLGYTFARTHSIQLSQLAAVRPLQCDFKYRL